MKKLMTILFLLFVLLLQMVGCGSDNGTVGESTENLPNVEESNGDIAPTDEEETKPEADGIYQEGALFQFGLVPVELDDVGYGYLNKAGEWVIEPQFKSATEFGPDRLAFAVVDGEWRCIDINGEIASDIIFYGVRPFSACGIARVQMKDENGVYAAYFNGKELKKFEGVEEGLGLGDFSAEGYAVIRLDDGSEGMIDSDYNWVIPATQGLHLNGLAIQNGLCAFDHSDGTCGFYDENGDIALLMSEDYYEFDKGVVFGKNGLAAHDNCIYDKNWNKVLDIHSIVDNVDYYVSASFTSSDWLTLRLPPKSTSYGSYTYLDAQGNIMAYASESDMKHLTNNTPTLVADRICLYMYVELDEEGMVVGLSDGSDPDAKKKLVVLNEKAEFVYSPYNLDLTDLHNYYTDGYTWAEVISGDDVYVIIDNEGTVLWKNSEDTPVDSIGGSQG